MNAFNAEEQAIENYVYMRSIKEAVGAHTPEEALTASRALANAMNEIMTITGAADTLAAVEKVRDLMLIEDEIARRKAEYDETPHKNWTKADLFRWFLQEVAHA